MLSPIEATVINRVEDLAGEMIEFLQQLVRIPTVNPPGENYIDCAELIGEKLKEFGYQIKYVEVEDLPGCSTEYPRLNLIGRMEGGKSRPTLHFNGHIDVVPPGQGWTIDPFAAVLREGRLYGRGVTDQKAGIAASIFAVEALRRAGVKPAGSIEQSATVDEESGGFAGVAYLAQRGYFRRDSIDYVIITEPLDYDRICLGHRGVYWFEVAMHGRIAHGSMPFLGASAIDRMARFVEQIERELKPRLSRRITRMPVEPQAARAATININAIVGGQPIDTPQTPCVADSCRAIFDRRFLLEENLEEVRREITELLDYLTDNDHRLRYTMKDIMIVHPTMTAPDSELVQIMSSAIISSIGLRPALIASPGTYDQKHFARIAEIEQCIAYGPGLLNLAHQPDEYCQIDQLILSCKAMALAAMRLVGVS